MADEFKHQSSSLVDQVIDEETEDSDTDDTEEDSSESEIEDDDEKYNEKWSLASKISKLPGNQLRKIVSIILDHEPTMSLSKDDDIEKLEIDFLTLKSSTLMELDTFVNSCLESCDQGSSKYDEPMSKRGEKEQPNDDNAIP